MVEQTKINASIESINLIDDIIKKMYTVKKNSDWDLRIDIETDKPCELYIDKFPNTPKKDIRILWVVEPDGVSGIKNAVIENHKEFDLILTHNEDILNNCSNSRLYPHGMTWILDFDLSKEKEFVITSLIGGKKLSPNHLIRQQLPEIQNKITSVPVHLFNSLNNMYQGNGVERIMVDRSYKNELFYSQFHIAIENFSMKNYFSEKLIDCFQTNTIPIYLGCTNISDFFDTRGMIIVNDIDDVINKCNMITPTTYQEMLPFVTENYQRSIKYAKFRETLRDEIINYVKNY